MQYSKGFCICMDYACIKLDVYILTRLVKCFCTTGNFSECLKVFEFMMHNGSSPAVVVSFYILLHNLCKNRFLRTAYQALNDFRHTKILPDVTSYNILIDASIREHNQILTNKLLEKMNKQNLKPDAFTYGSLIRGHCKEGKISDALLGWNQMPGRGLIPSVVIYNTLLQAMLQRGIFWEFMSLLKVMVVEGFQPDEVTLRILNQAVSNGWMKRSPKVAGFWS